MRSYLGFPGFGAVGLRVSGRPGRVAGGISAPAPTDSVRRPLGLYGSCHPEHQTRGTEGTHLQCANMLGYLSVIPRQHFMAFFLTCSRLYFLRIQRTR